MRGTSGFPQYTGATSQMRTVAVRITDEVVGHEMVAPLGELLAAQTGVGSGRSRSRGRTAPHPRSNSRA